MVTKGAKHEIDSARICLPYRVQVTVDHEQSLDDISVAIIQNSIRDDFARKYADDLTLQSFATAQSHESTMLQLADTVAGALNRKHNHQEEPHYKNELAEMVMEKLGLQGRSERFDGIDASAWLSIV